MSFSCALYYPSINIKDPKWLKTAALYWDTIETIVPKGVEKPYAGKDQEACADAGILRPRHAVDHPDVLDRVGRIARDFYRTEHAKKLAEPAGGFEEEEIYAEKMSADLRLFIAAKRKDLNNLETLVVSKPFGHYYMTLLATELARKLGQSPLTDRVLAHELVKDVVRGAGTHVPNHAVAGETLLVEFTLKQMRIDPETRIEKIIKFREANKAELARFRTEVGNLARQLQNMDPEGAKLIAADIYKNQIKPAVNDLQKSLRSSRIAWLTDGALKIAGLSMSTAALISTVAAPAVTLAAAGGLTVLALAASRYHQEGETRRNSPYSYLLNLKRLRAA